MLTRGEALTRVTRAADAADAAVFTGNGLIPRALYALSDRAENFYMMGSMGLALPMAVGFSKLSGAVAFAVEGDGNTLMGLSAAPLAAAATGPLVHVVLDNGMYESTGGQGSPAPRFSFVKMAEACGYSTAVSVAEGDALSLALSAAVGGGHVGLVHVLVATDGGPPPPRVPFHPAEITERFIARFREDVSRQETAQ
ncbi:thiamine pyrophosphate-dependent enzyme [Streptosporangium sp. NPDC000239]|uniref:Thiamine pyrophosphate-dependent enzyme n=1 Tax=Streptosporangium jomthongense TaxID=1193683 RepID=A0ABV8EVT7_9ACTN